MIKDGCRYNQLGFPNLFDGSLPIRYSSGQERVFTSINSAQEERSKGVIRRVVVQTAFYREGKHNTVLLTADIYLSSSIFFHWKRGKETSKHNPDLDEEESRD